MKKITLLFAALILIGGMMGQNSAPTRQWIKSNNGFSSSNETVVKSVKDNNGFYYVLSNDNNDALITKFDNSGAAVNTFRYNEASNNTNFGYDIKVDASGNIYVCGEAFVTSYWNWKPTIVKLSPTGTIIWEQVIACQYYTSSQANAMAFDNSNNVYFAGANSDSLSVGLISATGTLVWEKKYHPIGYTIGEAFDVVTDAANNAYVTGKIMNSLTGNYDYTTFKTNSAGSFLWTKFLNGNANSDDMGCNIEIDGSGNTFVTGTIADTTATNTSVFLIKYNASGGQQWSKKYHKAGQTFATCGDLTLDAAGNNFISTNHFTSPSNASALISKNTSSGSQSYSTVYNDVTYISTESHSIKADVLGNLFVGGTKQSASGDRDMFASKFNTSGVLSWATNYDSYYSDDCKTLHLDNGNNAVLNGTG
ncbi:MAG: hypothetical protein IAF38_07170, partial [Bacteroidia bacterium]|nr:hypothetical protein [Bacteroidia bacterium]